MAAGSHPLVIDYFQATGYLTLTLSVSYNGGPPGPVDPSWLWHSPPAGPASPPPPKWRPPPPLVPKRSPPPPPPLPRKPPPPPPSRRPPPPPPPSPRRDPPPPPPPRRSPPPPPPLPRRSPPPRPPPPKCSPPPPPRPPLPRRSPPLPPRPAPFRPPPPPPPRPPRSAGAETSQPSAIQSAAQRLADVKSGAAPMNGVNLGSWLVRCAWLLHPVALLDAAVPSVHGSTRAASGSVHTVMRHAPCTSQSNILAMWGQQTRYDRHCSVSRQMC